MTVRADTGHSRFWFRYSDNHQFIVDEPAATIWAWWPAPFTLDDAATYLLGPVLGFVLRRRGVVCLHAGCIAVESKAVAIVGAAGAGKSTTVAAFYQHGHAVVTDDVLPLALMDGSFRVQPAYPRVRLWSDSATGLFGSAHALPLLTPNWDKRFLKLKEDNREFVSGQLPLSAIYFLGDRTRAVAPKVGPLTERGALIKLIVNTYANYLLNVQQRAAELEVLGQLVTAVPVREVCAPDGFEYLSALRDAILEDLKTLRS